MIVFDRQHICCNGGIPQHIGDKNRRFSALQLSLYDPFYMVSRRRQRNFQRSFHSSVSVFILQSQRTGRSRFACFTCFHGPDHQELTAVIPVQITGQELGIIGTHELFCTAA